MSPRVSDPCPHCKGALSLLSFEEDGTVVLGCECEGGSWGGTVKWYAALSGEL